MLQPVHSAYIPEAEAQECQGDQHESKVCHDVHLALTGEFYRTRCEGCVKAEMLGVKFPYSE
jgi:hypothetical protein